MKDLETFRESLTPEEYASIEEGIQKLIDEKAKVIAECVIAEEKSRLEELAEEFCEKEVKDRLELKEKELTESYSNKIEEFKKVATEELQTLADKYVTQEINEAVSKKESELNEKFEEKVAKLEESVLDNLDKFLELEITSKIDNSLLESVAKYKAHEPIIEGILSLFENNLVALPQDGAKQVYEAKAEVEVTKSKLNESIFEKIQLQSKIDTLKTGLLIATKCDGLTAKQKNRVVSMFEGKSFDEVNSKIDTFVEVLNENENDFLEVAPKKGSKKETLNEDIFDDVELDDIEDESKLDESENSGDESLDNMMEKINRLF